MGYPRTPKIDRIACPWLIARFIDQTPEFLYVSADRVLAVAEEAAAIPYDIHGVELSHDGDLAGILALAANKNGPLDESDPSVQQVKMITGAGFGLDRLGDENTAESTKLVAGVDNQLCRLFAVHGLTPGNMHRFQI